MVIFLLYDNYRGGSRGPGTLRGERELDALFQELDSLSCCEGDDSGPDMDSLSVGSTPKPSLRPFFTNSKNMLHENLMGWCKKFCIFFHPFALSIEWYIENVKCERENYNNVAI